MPPSSTQKKEVRAMGELRNGNCYICKKRKNRLEFHKDSSKPDGLCSRCTDCDKVRGRKRFKKQGKTEDYRQRKSISSLAWRKRNGLKTKAHGAVSHAIAVGKLVRPSACTSCSKRNIKLHAHHSDYRQRLKVTWLCIPCHEEVHHG